MPDVDQQYSYRGNRAHYLFVCLFVVNVGDRGKLGVCIEIDTTRRMKRYRGEITRKVVSEIQTGRYVAVILNPSRVTRGQLRCK